MTNSISVISAKCLALLLVYSFSSSIYAQDLQRFFMLEAERKMLDKASVERVEAVPSEVDSSSFDSTAEFEPFTVTLTGLLIRNNHQHTVWLNGYALSVQELPPSILLDSSTATLIQIELDHGGYSSIAIGQELLITDSDYIKAFRLKLMAETLETGVNNDVIIEPNGFIEDDMSIDEGFES